MTTLTRITEQVKRLLTGNPSYNMEVTNSEIKALVVQTVQSYLKTEKLQVNLPLGDIFPQSVSIATYDSLPVESYGSSRAKTVLPAYPISYPRNLGVWWVSDMNFPDVPFIPLLSGQWGLIKPMEYLPSISGIISYENEGLNIIYTSDITKNYPSPVTEVRVKLLITDIRELGDWDLLPVPPDAEVSIVQQVFSIVVGQPVVTHYDDGKDDRPQFQGGKS